MPILIPSRSLHGVKGQPGCLELGETRRRKPGIMPVTQFGLAWGCGPSALPSHLFTGLHDLFRVPQLLPCSFSWRLRSSLNFAELFLTIPGPGPLGLHP